MLRSARKPAPETPLPLCCDASFDIAAAAVRASDHKAHGRAHARHVAAAPRRYAGLDVCPPVACGLHRHPLHRICPQVLVAAFIALPAGSVVVVVRRAAAASPPTDVVAGTNNVGASAHDVGGSGADVSSAGSICSADAVGASSKAHGSADSTRGTGAGNNATGGGGGLLLRLFECLVVLCQDLAPTKAALQVNRGVRNPVGVGRCAARGCPRNVCGAVHRRGLEGSGTAHSWVLPDPGYCTLPVLPVPSVAHSQVLPDPANRTPGVLLDPSPARSRYGPFRVLLGAVCSRCCTAMPAPGAARCCPSWCCLLLLACMSLNSLRCSLCRAQPHA
eukprot:357218-Chlamydomonas_euryale.AAC.2